MNYTYIVRCRDGSLYTGWTNNLEKRIKDHNAGNGAKYTKNMSTNCYKTGMPTLHSIPPKNWKRNEKSHRISNTTHQRECRCAIP